MYRIMLADDEGIMLEALRNIIESNFGDECEIAAAKTGRAVVELAESFRPDIAFMDIQMPGLNGIQAMKEIQKFNSNIVFIVISAYDKFSYAREAINLGVLEYLTKPVNKRVIVDVCMKAMHKVDEARQKRSDDLEIREKLETVIPILESGYIYNLLLQDAFHNYNDKYRQLMGIEEEYGFIIVIEFGDNNENGTLTNAVGAGVRAEKNYPELREIAREFFHCLVGPVMGNRVVLMVPSEKDSISYEERVHILTRTRNMVHKLEARIDSRFRAGIGRTKKEDNLRESYAEALKALREEDSHVVHINDITLLPDEDTEMSEEMENRYFQSVLKQDIAGASEAVESLFRWMENHYADQAEEMKFKTLELLIRLEARVSEDGRSGGKQKNRSRYFKELQDVADTEQLKNWFWEQTRDICRNMEAAKEKQSETVMEKAQSYIRENFQKDLTLDEVSRVVDISPYYFSKLFKQETGENFIEYLTKVRIRNAKDLLRNPEYSIKEVCVRSGYGDPNYFSRIFKKYEGITPSEYRERL